MGRRKYTHMYIYPLEGRKKFQTVVASEVGG